MDMTCEPVAKEPVCPLSQPNELAYYRELIGLISQRIDSKPEELRTVLRLALAGSDTPQEVAEKTGRTEKAVENAVYRFRQELRETFGDVFGKPSGVSKKQRLAEAKQMREQDYRG